MTTPKLDAYGRPPCPSTWGGTAMPRPGTYRVRLVKGGLWLPATVAVEQTCDPEGDLCDRWAPTLRILDWSWHRWELIAWEGSLHPVTLTEFTLMRSRRLPCGPLEPYDAGQSRLAI